MELLSKAMVPRRNREDMELPRLVNMGSRNSRSMASSPLSKLVHGC